MQIITHQISYFAILPRVLFHYFPSFPSRRNQEEKIEIFGFEETKYERKWKLCVPEHTMDLTLERTLRGVTLGKPGHSGKVAPSNY